MNMFEDVHCSIIYNSKKSNKVEYNPFPEGAGQSGVVRVETGRGKSCNVLIPLY